MIRWIRNLFDDSKYQLMSTKIEDLEAIVEGLVEDRNVVVEELGELLTHCDKCEADAAIQCFKCNSTGIIKKKQLYDWPW